MTPDSSSAPNAEAAAAPEKALTLGDVIQHVPPECYQNPTWKGLAYLVRDITLYAGAVAALVWTDHPLILVPLWIIASLLISALFILGHDAAHGSLFRSSRLCYGLGQLAMLPALHIFEAWVLGHNRIHHGHTVRQEMDFVWHPLTRDQYAALSPAKKLLHRIEWSALGAGIYYLIEVYWKKMVWFTPPGTPTLARRIRRDQRIVLAFFFAQSAALIAGGLAVYGSIAGAAWMWLKVFFVPWILFNYVIGFCVYVHHIDDKIQWRSRRDWTKFQGQMEGTTILHMPRWIDFFLHKIMIHVPHHVDMRIPFYGLPKAAQAIVARFGDVVRERRFRLMDYIRATRRCKLYDFERGVWTGYEGAGGETSA